MAATVAVPSAIVLKVLTTNNYEDWSFRVRTYLLAKGLWKVVESAMEPSDGDEADFEAWSKNNAEALHAIHITCGEDIFPFIRGIDTAKAAWNTLEKKLKPAGLPKREDARSEHQSPMDGELQLKDLKPEPVVEGCNNNASSTTNDLDRGSYQHFFDCVEYYWRGNNESEALEFLKQYPHPIRELRHPSSNFPALHFAASEGNLIIVKELVRLMTEEDLEEILDPSGRTAICCAIENLATLETVKLMIEKNKKLLSIVDPSTNMIPLVIAHGVKWYRVDVVKYLHSVTPLETLNAHQAAQIISQAFVLKRFDISWDLIQCYPSLGITKDLSGKYPLNRLAESMKWEHLFLSESGLNFWEQWIYDRIVIPPSPKIDDISTINVNDPENHKCNQRCLIHSVTSLFRRFFGGLLGISRIQRMKLVHAQVHEFLHCMCEVMKNKDVTQIQDDSLLRSAIFRAVEQGKAEFITHICSANPNIYRITNEQDMTLFQFAADCRQEKIYSLVYVYYYRDKIEIFRRRDKFDNNMLHIVGNFSSFAQTKVDNIRGAALQLQRERQWFKEVQSQAELESLEVINHTDQAPPRVVFTKYHRELMKEGEKSMKETATSCTVVGALVVTMMFAAAFTVPGGNNEDTGAPMFLKAKEFMVFIVSDAISLFSSTTSVMIFLGILTSRYKEDDFLKSLPTKMILGLFTLFLSIATMMITFSAALYIMLHGKLCIIIPVILLSSVPIASFVWMQFPFFVEIFVSTYGADIFDKKNLEKTWETILDC
uniref:uncharacterized protein LOC101315069 isoform X2 n=1 Tax=Fragaria vesca subsp. vesca TaxID=101020 RepID=UPI0005C8A473|nr:PREDICTED: uncharacterized protein LOC101315069 isoform X2 [Fragaria vesca subsp. vesca]